MNDRLVRAMAASLLAGSPTVLIGATSFYVLHFSKTWLGDLLSLFAFSRGIRTGIELVLAMVLAITFFGFFGAVFALLIVPIPGQGRYVIRSITYGYVVWSVTLLLGTLVELPRDRLGAWQTGTTQVVNVLIWGLLFGWLMKRWDEVHK